MSLHPLLPTTLDETATRRLFCFPHAGGGSAMFYRWARYLPDDVALAPLRLPGREDRLADPPYDNLATLADQAATAIASLEPRPSLFVGHSLGGYVAFEVAQRLCRNRQHLPHQLIVAACGAPRQGKAKHPIAELPEQEFLDEVARRYDGIPDAVRQSPQLLAMVLPSLRADIRMIESYDYTPGEPLPVDITAIGGTDDVGVGPDRLSGWRPLTAGRFSLRLFPGGHFFLHPPSKREIDPDRDTTPAPLALILNALPQV